MEHAHISAASAVTVFLAVVVTFGLANVIAMRFKGHPAADAWLDLYGHGA
jgi:hypothetical protein